MAKVSAGMTLSLDGFVADADGSAGPLYPDLADLRDTEYMRGLIDETGAVLMGRRTFAMADPDSYAGVLTREAPEVMPKQDENLTFTFVTEGVEPAVAQAAAAAGGRAVQVVGGPSVCRQLFDAGLVDELHLDFMPVLLGDGLRFFADEGSRPRLEKLAAQQIGQRASLRYRVEK